jgi:histone H3/H4
MRLVREIAMDISSDVTRWQISALQAVQDVAEDYLVCVLEGRSDPIVLVWY